MAWFPWKTLSFLLLIGTAAIINLDVQRSGGSFKTSNTGQLLTDLGQYDRAVGGAEWTLERGRRGGAWLETTTQQQRAWLELELPVHLARGRRAAGPYLEAAGAKAAEAAALARLGLERAGAMAGQAVAGLEAQMPGLGAKLEGAGREAARWAALGLATVQELGLRAKEGALRLVRWAEAGSSHS
jgi:hypothetical protein